MHTATKRNIDITVGWIAATDRCAPTAPCIAAIVITWPTPHVTRRCVILLHDIVTPLIIRAQRQNIQLAGNGLGDVGDRLCTCIIIDGHDIPRRDVIIKIVFVGCCRCLVDKR